MKSLASVNTDNHASHRSAFVATPQLPPQIPTPCCSWTTSLLASLPDKKTLQTAFLIATVVLAVFSLIPSLGFESSLALRSVALLATAIFMISNWSNDPLVTRISKGAKLITMAAALASMALAIPELTTAAYCSMVAISAVDIGQSIKDRQIAQSLLNFGFFAVNALACAAIITGSWEIIVTASAVSACVMAALAIWKAVVVDNIRNRYDIDTRTAIDVLCYIALTVLGAGGAVRAAELSQTRASQAHFSVKNESDYTMTVYDNQHHVIKTVNPHESLQFNWSADDTFDGGGYGRFSSVLVTYEGPEHSKWFSADDYFDYQTTIIQNAMVPCEFPTLPIGSQMIADDILGKK